MIETLNSAVNPTLLASFEAELGCPLPPPVRDTFLIADGQDIESSSYGLFFGLHLLPLEEVIREWTFWRQAEHDPMAGQNAAVLATMASVPPKWIKSLYACRGWLPLITDHSGNYIGVDLDPGPGGAWGQVIVFGRDFDRKCVLWRGEGEGGWGKWLAAFVDELESGEGWETEKSGGSDDEEDVGYESYNGGATYGESGRGLRLAGEYKGWNVMEAWWDKSVRKWEGLGLGMDVEEVEKGMEEARRLAGVDDVDEQGGHGKGKGKQKESTGLGIRTGDRTVGEVPGECFHHFQVCILLIASQSLPRRLLLNHLGHPSQEIQILSFRPLRRKLELLDLYLESSIHHLPTRPSASLHPSILCRIITPYNTKKAVDTYLHPRDHPLAPTSNNADTSLLLLLLRSTSPPGQTYRL